MKDEGTNILLRGVGYALVIPMVPPLLVLIGRGEWTPSAISSFGGLVAAIFLAAGGLIQEIMRYSDWEEKTGVAAQKKIFIELREATKQTESSRAEPTFAEAHDALREVWQRAKRRWPVRKKELGAELRQPMSLAWKQTLLVVGGIEVFTVLMGALTHRAYVSTTTAALSTAIPFAVCNLLVALLGLLFWVAGDDDEGGAGPKRPAPVPTPGHAIQPAKRPIRHAVFK